VGLTEVSRDGGWSRAAAGRFFAEPGNAKTALRRLLRPAAYPFLSDKSGREVDWHVTTK